MDEQLISEAFINRFQPGSAAAPIVHDNPSVKEIRDVFDRVHARTVSDMQQLASSSLNETVSPEHPMFSTKGGAIR